METPNVNPLPAAAASRRVKILGVGSAGVTMIESLARTDFAGAEFIALNTDAAPPTTAEFVLLETPRLRGLGTGGDPERGHEIAEANFPRLSEVCAGADVVFLLAGLGGGTGSGVSPVVARAARDRGAVVLAFVTLPFECEGSRRHEQARAALEQLKTLADGIICLPNQNAFKLLAENATVLDTLRLTAQLLVGAAHGVWRLLKHRGLLEIHFEQLCSVLRQRHGESCFAAVESAGATRVDDVLAQLAAHPMLDGGQVLAEAATVMVSIVGGTNLTMSEVNRIVGHVNASCSRADVITGAALVDDFGDRLAVTIIAARRTPGEKLKLQAARPQHTEPPAPSPLGFELLPEVTTEERPESRLVPPAAPLSAEQREQILVRHGGKAARVRKSGPRLKQATLQLDIITKGHFDKSKPTIHKGEDLDVPTYIRRGIALN